MKEITPCLWFDADAEEAVRFYVAVFKGSKIDGVTRCGWLTDRYGVSWQIVPRMLGKMLQGKNPRRTQSVMRALFQMKKLDIRRLRRAYTGAA